MGRDKVQAENNELSDSYRESKAAYLHGFCKYFKSESYGSRGLAGTNHDR